MNHVNLSGVEEAARLQLCLRASARYKDAGRFAYHFAYFKLKTDPLFTDILLSGALGSCTDLCDLGCGQGLLSAWLVAAQEQMRQGPWPGQWPPPPCPERTRGVDLRESGIRSARTALGERAEYRVLDLREANCDGADAVAILDAIHYIGFAEQQQLLQRLRAALPAGGTLLLRVADAGSGFAYRLAQWIDRANDLLRDRRLSAFHCRSVEAWLTLLKDCGFEARRNTRRSGSSFSNTLLIARAV